MWTDKQMDIWTDMMKLVVAFCNFVRVPTKDTGTFGTRFSVKGLMLL